MKDNETVDSVTVQDENGEFLYLDVDQSGGFVEAYTDVETIGTLSLTPGQKTTICNILVAFSGGGIGVIYQAVASAIGGPVAAGVVWTINTFGWGYVSSKC